VARRNSRAAVSRRLVHGILLLDKPQGGSSNHALQRAKRLFNARKAGHTGSLDPLATGMLPICFGEATKLSAFLLDADKAYETTMVLGVRTDSADADGQVISTDAIPRELDAVRFRAIADSFKGPQKQIPPMVSAIKIDGKPLYKLAREGIEIERKPRDVTIHELEVLAFDGSSARLRVRCSKGTYIRSLVSDIGDRIGCGAHLTVLRRSSVSPFDGSTMYDFDKLEHLMTTLTPEAGFAALDDMLLPLDAGLGHLPKVTLRPEAVVAFRHGQGTPSDTPINAQNLRMMEFSPDDFSAQSFSGESGRALCRVYEPWSAGGSDPAPTRLIGLGEMARDNWFLTPKRVIQWS